MERERAGMSLGESDRLTVFRDVAEKRIRATEEACRLGIQVRDK